MSGEAKAAAEIIREAAASIGAAPADIHGLWNVPGHPELTTMQMLSLAARKETPHAE